MDDEPETRWWETLSKRVTFSEFSELTGSTYGDDDEAIAKAWEGLLTKEPEKTGFDEFVIFEWIHKGQPVPLRPQHKCAMFCNHPDHDGEPGWRIVRDHKRISKYSNEHISIHGNFKKGDVNYTNKIPAPVEKMLEEVVDHPFHPEWKDPKGPLQTVGSDLPPVTGDGDVSMGSTDQAAPTLVQRWKEAEQTLRSEWGEEKYEAKLTRYLGAHFNKMYFSHLKLRMPEENFSMFPPP